MKRTEQNMRMIIGVMVLSILAAGFWSYPKSAIASEAENAITKRIIKIEADGNVLHYQETLYWNERNWSKILADKSNFSSRQIE